MLVPLLLAVAATSARAQVAGIGASSVGLNINFDLDVYSSTLNNIVASVNEGPNRTCEDAVPVKKIYGVNFGNWLILEPWMSPTEWEAMQGQFAANGDCSTVRQSEWSLSTFLGQDATNAAFKKHWESWMTQADVDGIVAAKLNTVRLPLPFWIIEDIVDRTHEPYAQGGLDELIRGLNMFNKAGLNVILDHHALPGVAASGQMFAGNCTTLVEFYSSASTPLIPDYNYKRAVTWGIVMAFLSHAHPAFEKVFTIEGVNEPIQNAALTPGLGRFEVSYVLGIRAIELLMGITCDATSPLTTTQVLTDDIALPALIAAIPIITKLAIKYDLLAGASEFGWAALLGSKGQLTPGKMGAFLGGRKRKCLSTQFMDQGWQYTGSPANPADAAIGPQLYDNHIYFNFGGVAPNATEESYMQTLCQIKTVATEVAAGNAPLYTGEWSIATAFNTTDAFLRQWGDAQKLTWSGTGSEAKSVGWVFWNWKVDQDARTYPILGKYLQWSYRDALAAGLFTPDPADYFDENVCVPYLNATGAA
ncbi:glycoside hydrolase family 5 protein [Athelia psychrophila]|uniref:Glycoside hydrolase family 5 protein n=1 Tax=Athelia psychrophila TaxID=1759441 RepID=A0A165YIV4_9AGAM|nr:glycoside hydrolase family 5 protein [Fibularhizoctonia sp. CBS 109695]